ncbi:MAG: hypothetical protein RI958_375 [Actinomycetota bacterium]|jgi:predicted DsbA family dithiol-disulfide isomerase
MAIDSSEPTGEIEVYADIWCPFAHVGLRRLVTHRDRVGSPVRLRVRPWPLELVNGVPMDGDAVEHKVADLRAQVSPDLFTGFTASTFPTTTLPALALVEAAYDEGIERGEAMSLAVRDSLFEHGHDIGDPMVLTGLAERLGTPLAGPRHTDAVIAAWHEGRDRGVIGSPHFFTPSGGFFCPVLDIARDGEHLRIRFDSAAFDTFVAACFSDHPA